MKTMHYFAAAAAALLIGGGTWLAVRDTAAAPAVEYTRLDGSRAKLSELRGKVVLINFWATSCVTCVKEMPELAETHRRFQARGYDTLAVAMSYDTPDYVANFAQTRQLPFQVTIDRSGQIARSFGDVQLTPTSVLINKRGEIVKRYVGRPDFAALHKLVEKLLAEA